MYSGGLGISHHYPDLQKTDEELTIDPAKCNSISLKVEEVVPLFKLPKKIQTLSASFVNKIHSSGIEWKNYECMSQNGHATDHEEVNFIHNVCTECLNFCGKKVV